MNTRSKGRGRPGPDAINLKHIIHDLEDALNVEAQYMANPITIDQYSDGDALLARDGATKKLRFLKLWFELPTQVFHTCINLLDRFLTRMKVKPTYLGCASISCLYVASKMHNCELNLSQLVMISQVKCKPSDVERMSDIICDKLDLQSEDLPMTVFNFLDLFYNVLECAANQLNMKSQFSTMIQKKNLLTRLEIVMLDSTCASMRPSVIALALIQADLERFLSAEIPTKSPYYSIEMYKWLTVIYQLQCMIIIIPNEFLSCFTTVKNVMQKYDNNVRSTRKMRLKWRVSLRMNSLKPSENFSTNLHAIYE